MAQLGRLEFVVQDSAGNALAGIAVEIRRQGAQINGAQAGSPYTVDAPNGIVATDIIALGTGATTRTVASVTATTVTTSGGDLGAVVDDDRLTIVTALPTVYEDAEAGTTKANPLTTDSLGRASCYILGGKYDAHLSGAGITTTLLQDQVSVGGETTRSNIYMSGTAVAWVLDTLRAAAAGDTLLDIQTAGVSKFAIKGDGEIVAGAAGAIHTLTGNTTITGTLTATGAVTGSTTITAGTGLTVTTGDLEVSAATGHIRPGRVRFSRGTALAAADISLIIGPSWGDTATVDLVNGNDSVCSFRVNSSGTGQAANPVIRVTFKDGAWAGTLSPIAQVQRSSGDQMTVANQVSTSATAITITFLGTPVAGQNFVYNFFTFGRA